MEFIPLYKSSYPSARDTIGLFIDTTKITRRHSNYGDINNQAELLLDNFFSTIGQNKITHLTTSGSEALTTALLSTCERGDRVLIPDFTHPETLCSTVRAGMIPIFGHCEEKTWMLSMEVLEDRKDFFDAFIVVSPFGFNFDNSEYEKFALENGKKIVYDFIDAFPLVVKTSFPICYSFSYDKLLNIGEGGAVLFDTLDQKYRARIMCNFEDPGNGLLMSDKGYNGRLDEMRAASLVTAMNSFDYAESKAKKRNIMLTYFKSLGNYYCPKFDGISPLSRVVIGGVKDIDKILKRAEILGVQMKREYLLLSKMKGLRNVGFFTVSGKWADHCLSLPCDIVGYEFDEKIEIIKKVFDI